MAPPPPALSKLLGGSSAPAKPVDPAVAAAAERAAAESAAAAAKAAKAAARAQAEADAAAARAAAARARTTQLVTTGAAAVGGFALAKASAAGALVFRNLGGPSLLAASLRSPGALWGRTLRCVEYEGGPVDAATGLPASAAVVTLPRVRVATVEGLRRAIARAARCEASDVRQLAHLVPSPSGVGSAFPAAYEPITGPSSFAGLPDPAWIVWSRKPRSKPGDRLPTRAVRSGGGSLDAGAVVAGVVAAVGPESPDAADVAAAAAGRPSVYGALLTGLGDRPAAEVAAAVRAARRDEKRRDGSMSA